MELFYVALGLLVLFILNGIRIAYQYERSVVFRLGKYTGIRGPGLFWIIPLIEWTQKVDMRTITAAVDQQEAITNRFARFTFN